MNIEERKKLTKERWNSFLCQFNSRVIEHDSKTVRMECDGCHDIFSIGYNSFVSMIKRNSYRQPCSCFMSRDESSNELSVIRTKISAGIISYRSAMNEIKRSSTLKVENFSTEKLYLLVNEMEKAPTCEHCDEDCRFVGTKEGYSRICGSKACISISMNRGYKNKFGEKYDRFKHAMLVSRGIPYIAQDPEHRKNVKILREEKWIESNKKVLSKFNIERDGSFLVCKTCNSKTPILTTQRVRIQNDENPCIACNPIVHGSSKAQAEISSFIVDLGFPVINNHRLSNTRTEIDIFVPDKNVGFEFNGLFWHSEQYKCKTYHADKSLAALENGINLFHVWEDEWITKREIVKSRIKNVLGKSEVSIQARKCKVLEISNQTRKNFLNDNHIQGNVNSQHSIGLFFKDELVSVMTFGNSRRVTGKKGNEIELLRFCSLLNHNVTGGASKLFSYFVNYLGNGKNVISYSHSHWGTGNVYRKLGFEFVHDTPPSYHYVMNDRRFHRYQFRKSKLVEDGHDPSLSEHDIMLERKIYRIYDCGCKLWKHDFKL